MIWMTLPFRMKVNPNHTLLKNIINLTSARNAKAFTPPMRCVIVEINAFPNAREIYPIKGLKGVRVKVV